ncbi:toxin-antitoxin system YwqK family antitoxin [Luteirhabdus pelagi]|uniref:hypothetical protein n=1 Tax=Luteirhabdus pelagi TaxID=2792783 RepID=UPI001939E241|nr:hypothetical protein [Luteirhabdus pelagi]
MGKRILVDKVFNYNYELIGEYFYDDNNNLIKRKDSDPVNFRYSEYNFIYEENRIIEIVYEDQTYPSLNYTIVLYYNDEGLIYKDETYKNGQLVGERRYAYSSNGKLHGIIDENNNVNPTFTYNESGNVGKVRLLTSSDCSEEIIYNYEFDCAPTPKFGLGKIFQVEPLPYFGTEAVLPKNLSCQNMTLNLQSGTQWLYEYNEFNFPKTIEVRWDGVETEEPTLWRISYREIE